MPNKDQKFENTPPVQTEEFADEQEDQADLVGYQQNINRTGRSSIFGSDAQLLSDGEE